MKKNNKGFFLAETIVVIALVTTVMAFVFPNVTKLYENYKNRANYYDQTEDLYVLRTVYDLFKNDKINFLDPAPETRPASGSDIDPNNVKSVDILGFLTYKGYKGSDGENYGSGCLEINELLKIYKKNESNTKYSGTNNWISIGTGLDVIRKKNNGGTNYNRNDLFTCFQDLVGSNGSYNLDINGGAGLTCNTTKKKYIDFFSEINLEELYITGYMSELSEPSNYNFNRYLKRLKKTTYDKASYRLIGVFKDGNITRYASIKIENPNPNRHCNLGG